MILPRYLSQLVQIAQNSGYHSKTLRVSTEPAEACFARFTVDLLRKLKASEKA